MPPRSRGVLRIVFTSEDLALTRMAPRTALLWEMVGPYYDGWRRC